MNRQIFAISGGGFSMESESQLDKYLLQLVSGNEKVHICFIPTASYDALGYIEKFYEAFHDHIPTHLLREDMESGEAKEKLMRQDIVYVGGGNTQYMLEVWKETSFLELLIEAYHQGVILAGISAGAMCWFDTCFSEMDNELYEEFKGIGMLEGTFCPHYNDKERKQVFDEWLKIQGKITSYLIEDYTALHFKNEVLVNRIVSN
ncbi:Type 1 glutamine amidotransferase-like domain-containing protein [Sporosarcina sp. FSL K6-3457]|uniref:Type 1 glutamine amidotransferase-like domain-containing protein n=1 Tax=Sporosarcina sp. FSL K6-3457 TaxID=2978204 RepID=UPI0030F7A020